MSQLLKLPGRELGRGRNSEPVGHHRVTTYLIEEVMLPHPTEVEIRGKTKRVIHAFRVTIFGGPFQVASLAWIIRIGDEAVGWKSGDEAIGWAVEHKNLDAITAVTFDRSLLREGAALHACYAGCTELPEKLKLKGAKESVQ